MEYDIQWLKCSLGDPIFIRQDIQGMTTPLSPYMGEWTTHNWPHKLGTITVLHVLIIWCCIWPMSKLYGANGRNTIPLHSYKSPQVSNPDMHHGTCIMHMQWCMPGSLTSGFLWSRCWGKRSWHSRHIRNPQIYLFGKRPIAKQCNSQLCSSQWQCGHASWHTIGWELSWTSIVM